SEELTEEQINEIRAQTVKAGDWALITLKPFISEETLTVTMKNGDSFTINVTDSQIKKTVITASGEKYEITLTYGPDAEIPEGADLSVREILDTQDSESGENGEYTEYLAKSADKLNHSEDEVKYARYFDISIVDAEGNEVHPASAVEVRITLADREASERPVVLHFDSDKDDTVVMRSNDNGETLRFTTTGFSVYGVVVVEAEEGVFEFRGEGYTVRVSYTEEAEIPIGTLLEVSEIEFGSDEYLKRLGQAWSEVNKEYLEAKKTGGNPSVPLVNLNTAVFFNITLTYNGEEIEPKVPVQVEIDYDNGLYAGGATEFGVAHYKAENEIELIEDVETVVEDDKVLSYTYEQGSFSDVGTYAAREMQPMPMQANLAPGPDDAGGGRLLETAGLSDATLEEIVRSASDSSGLLRAAGDTEEPYTNDNSGVVRPEAEKLLEANEDENHVKDGTYTLTLSVTGHSQITHTIETQKSNVLFVMDRSSSMITNLVDTETETFWYYGTWQSGETAFRGDIGPDSGYTFYGVIDGEYVELNTSYTYWNGNYQQTVGGWGWDNYHLYYEDGNNGFVEYPIGSPLYVKSSKTRMVAEQEALSTIFSQLMDLNDESGEDADVVEISLISFGDERFDKKSWSSETELGSQWQSGRDPTTLNAVASSNRYTSGTNWEDALQYAKEIITAKKTADEANGNTGEDYYVVFLTDGEPTAVHGESGGAYHRDSDGLGGGCIAAYEEAKDEAKDLVDNGVKFYNIFTYRQSENALYSWYLSNYAYTGVNHNGSESEAKTRNFIDAKTMDDLRKAFNDIFYEISDAVGHTNVSITDTMTTDAMATTIVEGETSGYVYKVTDSSDTLLYTVTAEGDISNPTVTFNVPASSTKNYTATASTVGGKTVYSVTTVEGQTYKMALADVDSENTADHTRGLTWDLAPVGFLMDGCTYSVSFIVWPDQKAYDYVAGLNNGIPGYEWNTGLSTYQDLTDTKGYEIGGVDGYPSIVYYPDSGLYAVLTNTEQKLHYTVTEIVTNNDQTSTTTQGPYYKDLDQPDPMKLEAADSSIEKVWNVERDPSVLAQYLYNQDGTPKQFTLGFDILKDDDPTTAADDEANKYTHVTLGWDGSKYVWQLPSVQTVIYNGNECEVGMRWTTDFSIATGLMLSEDRMDADGFDKSKYPSGMYDGTRYYILDEGHDYTIKEDGLTYHFDFTAPVYHPMLVDGVLRSVELSNIDKVNMTADIDSMTAAGVNLSSLKIENTLRGYMHLAKKVVGKDGRTPVEDDDTKFVYDIVLENDTQPGPFTVAGDHVPWYGIDGLYYHDADDPYHYYQAEPNGTGSVTLRDENGPFYRATCDGDFAETAEAVQITAWRTADSEPVTFWLAGNEMTRDSDNYVHASLSISQDQVLSIANVPVETQYSITEQTQQGYDLVSIRKEIRDGDTVESGSWATDEELDEMLITGEIVTNRDNYITFTNKIHSANVTVKKTDDSGMPLSGATFTLTRTADANGVAVTDDPVTKPAAGETDTATYEFKNLADGSYTLHETPPAGYEAIGDITFDVVDGEITNISKPSEVEWNSNRATFTVENSPIVTSGQLTVRKQWLDFFGNATEHEGTIDLTLKQWVQEDTSQHTVSFYFRCVGNGNGGTNSWPLPSWTAIADRSATGAGDVTIQWDWNQWTTEQPFTISGLGSATYETSWSPDGVQFQNDGSGKGGRQTLTIHNVTSNLVLYILINNNNYTGTSSNLIYQPSFAGVEADMVETGGTKTVTLTSGDNWSQQFEVSGSGLLSESSTTLPLTYNGKQCYYTIDEETVPEGFTLYQITEDKLQSGILTAYNKKNTVDISVEKVDGNNVTTMLEGATFELNQLDVTLAGGRYLTDGLLGVEKTTGVSGTISFDDLGFGYYEIKETHAPDGYILTGDNAVYVKIDEDGVTRIAKDDTKTPDTWAEASDNSFAYVRNATVTVYNNPGAELPSSGGIGTGLFFAMGAALMIGAAAWYTVRSQRKLKRRRTRR
ncbi:MAG: LPXTG cell wall anchor domain-containing protein, partial [Clostridia bacterium]|nr:LPXTG cell wall anchor domain-containing protein [Clostridia bacterium]